MKSRTNQKQNPVGKVNFLTKPLGPTHHSVPQTKTFPNPRGSPGSQLIVASGSSLWSTMGQKWLKCLKKRPKGCLDSVLQHLLDPISVGKFPLKKWGYKSLRFPSRNPVSFSSYESYTCQNCRMTGIWTSPRNEGTFIYQTPKKNSLEGWSLQCLHSCPFYHGFRC